MKTTNRLLLFIPAILLLVFLIYHLNTNERINNLKESYNNLIQKRGYNWNMVNIAPDSIYFISFNNDTTWYYQKEKK